VNEMSSEDYNALVTQSKRSKYGNRPVDGFHSHAERDRYIELEMLEKGGAISNLECQPAFDIVVNATRIATYRADFRYVDNETGQPIVEDIKGGASTPVFRLKKKLVEALYDVQIREIRNQR
jgi:hypothetical protein